MGDRDNKIAKKKSKINTATEVVEVWVNNCEEITSAKSS
jgi:hypothetical protein